MKQIVCEMCGSNDLVKKDGKYICQHCGMQYDAEEAKKLLVEVDNSKQVENLHQLAHRELSLNDYAKAKEYYDKILIENPNDWEASFYSILGKAYGITKGQVPNAIAELALNAQTTIEIAKDNCDNAEELRKRLSTISSETVNTYLYLLDNNVMVATAASINESINLKKIVIASLTDIGHSIIKIGESGLLGDFDEWKSIVANTIRWRTAKANEYIKIYDKATREKYSQELAKYDPNYTIPEIKDSPACYVATAVYGSYDCPEVWTLRRFRDYSLAETWYGRAFVRTYYAISPTLVKWFGDAAWFKSLWRGTLDKMVNSLKNKGYDSTPYEDREW